MCVCFVNVYQFVCVILSVLVSRIGMWELIVLIPAHCLSSCFKAIKKHVTPVSYVFVRAMIMKHSTSNMLKIQNILRGNRKYTLFECPVVYFCLTVQVCRAA